MEKHASNNINYLKIKRKDLELLGNIRHWKNAKIAFEENSIWVKEITDVQTNSLAIQCIPFKELYYQNGTKLFLKESLLPTCSVPSLLWTAIQRGLAVELPPFNHNYFGVKTLLNIDIIPSSIEQPAFAIKTSMKQLKAFIETAPAVRLKKLHWTILEGDQVLLLGQPLLPIQGAVYWQEKQSLIPAGYQFNYPNLSNSIHQKISPKNLNWLLWETTGHCALLPKTTFQPLTLSSFRRSFPTKKQL